MSIDSNYGNYGSGSDPWSSYGLGQYSQSDMDGSGYYQAYEQQLISYIQNLKTQMATLQAGTTLYNQYNQYLSTAMGYLQQVDPQMASDPSLGGGWDPLSSPSMGATDPNSLMGDSSSQQQPMNSFPISYQDSTHVVTDEGDSTSITLSQNDPETRNIDVYQKDNTLVIPSNSATVNAVAQPDDAVSGATMVVVTFTCNGHTRTVKYHNVDRDDFKLDIQAMDKGQVTFDASLTSNEFAKKVTINEADDLANMQGTPPDETDSDTRTWNKNDSVDYYATEGTETDEIYADTVNITLPDRSDTAKVTKTGDHEYTVEIYDEEGKLLRTVHLYQVNGEGSINFNHLAAENLQYKDATEGASGGFKAWDDPSCAADPQITVNGQAGGALAGPLDPDNADDSVPSTISKDGKTATYDQDEDVSIHTYPDDDVTEHEISANGTVDIYPNSQSDSAFVDYVDGKIRIMITTKDKNGKSKMEWFYVDASMANKINLHMDSSKISYDSDNNVIPADIATKIIDGNGKDASTAMEKDALLQDPSIQELIQKGGYTEDQILKAMDDAGLTVDDLKNPPVDSEGLAKMVEFFKELDPDLEKLLKNTEALKSNISTDARNALRDALVKDLKLIYGDDVSAMDEEHNPLKQNGQYGTIYYATHNAMADDINIGGVSFDFIDGSTGGIEFSSWTFDRTVGNAEVDPDTGRATGITSWYSPAAEGNGDDGNPWQSEYSDDYEVGDEADDPSDSDQFDDEVDGVDSDDVNAGEKQKGNYD